MRYRPLFFFFLFPTARHPQSVPAKYKSHVQSPKGLAWEIGNVEANPNSFEVCFFVLHRATLPQVYSTLSLVG